MHYTLLQLSELLISNCAIAVVWQLLFCASGELVCDCGIYWSSSLTFWKDCEDVQVSKNQIKECWLTLSRPLNNNAVLAQIQELLPGGPGPLARK